jgi:arginyl-tRNA--protein-N-Asp/Glu arginylyltransferase
MPRFKARVAGFDTEELRRAYCHCTPDSMVRSTFHRFRYFGAHVKPCEVCGAQLTFKITQEEYERIVREEPQEEV